MPSDLPTGAHLPTGAPLPIPPPPPPPVAPSARPGDEAPRRLHPITPVLDLVVGMRQAALPLLVAALAGPDAMWALVAAVFVAAGILAFRVAQWRRFTYRIAGGELRVEEGILQRSQRALPLARIQQVDIERSLRHRITGVAVLRVDAASGGGGAEVSLAVVSDQDAQRLRNLLLAAKAPAQSPDGGPPVPAWAGAGQGAVEPGVLGRPAPR